MEAMDSEAVIEDGKVISDVTDAAKEELRKLVASVVYKRKTYPRECMKMNEKMIIYEIKRLENAEMRLKEDKNDQKFMKLVQKLGLSKTPKISFDDLNEAEERLLKCKKILKDINIYLKKRKQCNQ